MNKEELLNKAIRLNYGDEIPRFKGIYIIQHRRLHDSGFRLMTVIGHTEYDEELKDFKYYIISDGCSDVVDFQPEWEFYLKNIYNIKDIHLDINRNGLIHIWTNSKEYMKPEYLNGSNAMIDFTL